MIICQLYSRNHKNPSVSRIPVVITDKTTLARRAFVLGQSSHPEPNVRREIEWLRIQYSDTVPTGLDLNGQMTLEPVRARCMVEDRFVGCVLQCSAIDVSSHPVIVENGCALKIGKSVEILTKATRRGLPVDHGTCSQRHR
jgi:hypothetical protein